MVKDLFWQVLYHLQSVEPAFARGRMRSGYLRRFFKELKQTVQLVDFVGYNQNAVQWQIWMALPAHLLVRFVAHLSRWGHTFRRLAISISGTLCYLCCSCPLGAATDSVCK
jgi:hypothetical protein